MNIVLDILLFLLSLYSGITFSLYMLSSSSSTASFYFRILAAYACLLLSAIYGLFVSVTLRATGHHRSSQWAVARAFQWLMGLTTDVRFNVIGGKQHLETRPAVFVGNHQTALDILFLGAVFPKHCAVTAKKSLKRIPFLGWFMSLSGTVFIDRANSSTARKAFTAAAEEMKTHKQSVFIFPEGTRSNAETPTLLPFKKGAFHLAVQAGVPIVPVVSACYWGVLGLKASRFRAGEIPVIVLPPIPTANLDASDVEELTRYTRDLMLKALIKLTESAHGQQSALVSPPPKKVVYQDQDGNVVKTDAEGYPLPAEDVPAGEATSTTTEHAGTSSGVAL